MTSYSPEDIEYWIEDLISATVRRTMAEQFGGYVEPDDLEQHLHAFLVAKRNGPWADDPKRDRYGFLRDVLTNKAQDYCRDMRTLARPGTAPRWVTSKATGEHRYHTLEAMQREFWHPGRQVQPLGHDAAADTAYLRYGVNPDRLHEVVLEVPEQNWIIVAARLNGARMQDIAHHLDIPTSTAWNRFHAAVDQIGRRHGVVGSSVAGDRVELPDDRTVDRVVASGDRVSTEQVEHQAGFRAGSHKPFTQDPQTAKEAVKRGFDARPVAVPEPDKFGMLDEDAA